MRMSAFASACVRACACACMRACVRACMRARMRACVNACVRVCCVRARAVGLLQLMADGELQPQLSLDIDGVNATLPMRAGFELADDPVLRDLVCECSKPGRTKQPLIDAPHALMSRVHKGRRVCVLLLLRAFPIQRQ